MIAKWPQGGLDSAPLDSAAAFPGTCPRGVYAAGINVDDQRSASCSGTCPAGHVCEDSPTFAPRACRDGTYNAARGGLAADECKRCDIGHFCIAPSAAPQPCAPGRLGNISGLATAECAGTCPLGHWCALGAPAPVPCRDGTYGARTGLRAADECTPCPPHHFCVGGKSYVCGSDVEAVGFGGGVGVYPPFGSRWGSPGVCTQPPSPPPLYPPLVHSPLSPPGAHSSPMAPAPTPSWPPPLAPAAGWEATPMVWTAALVLVGYVTGVASPSLVCRIRRWRQKRRRRAAAAHADGMPAPASINSTTVPVATFDSSRGSAPLLASSR